MTNDFICELISKIKLFNYEDSAVFVNNETKNKSADKAYDSWKLKDSFSSFFRKIKNLKYQKRKEDKQKKNYAKCFNNFKYTSKKQK